MSAESKYLKRPEDFSYDLIKVDKTNFHLVINFIRDVLNGSLSEECLRWKYLENPTADFIGYAAYDHFTKQIVGFVSLIPQPAFGTEPKIIYQSGDEFINEQHAKKGVYRRLIKQCFREMISLSPNSFAYVIGSSQSVVSYTRSGWVYCGELKEFARPAFLSKFNKTKFIRSEFSIATASQAISTSFQRKVEVDSEKTAIQRGVDHDTWILSNPNKKFLVLKIKGDELSYVVFFIEKTHIMICDMFLPSAENGRKMMAFLDSEVSKKGFDSMKSYAQPDSKLANQLKAFGFYHNPLNFGPWNATIPIMWYRGEQELPQIADHLPLEVDLLSIDLPT